MTRRKYELRRRAERQEETRRRIVEAAVRLHGSIGPARTTITAIADEAGVERHTVYAHFPDERSLFRACSTHWIAQNPPPDPARWAALQDPRRRLEAALNDLYRWYAGVERELATFRRDAELVPAQAEVLAEGEAMYRAIAGTLGAGWSVTGARKKRLAAAIGHALEFETWRSLVRRQRLTTRQAVSLMVRLAEDAASGAR